MPKPLTPEEVEKHLAPSYEDTVRSVNGRLLNGCSHFDITKVTLYVKRLIEDFTKAGWHVRLINDDYEIGSRPSHLEFLRYPSLEEINICPRCNKNEGLYYNKEHKWICESCSINSDYI
jgi:hypothetical protein